MTSGAITALALCALVGFNAPSEAHAQAAAPGEPPATGARSDATGVIATEAASDTSVSDAAADTSAVAAVRALIQESAELGSRVLTGDEDITSTQFWERQHLGFDRTTVQRAWNLIVDLPERARDVRAFVADRQSAFAWFVGLTAVALALSIVLRKQVAVRCATQIGQWLQPLRTRMPAVVSRLTVSLVRLVSAVLAPLLVLTAYNILARVTHYGDPWFQALGDLLEGVTILIVVLGVLYELLLGGLLGVPKEHARRLHRDLKRAILIGFFGLVAIAIARRAGADPALLALATFVVRLSFLLAAFLALRWRTGILELFPQFENRMYQGFLQWLHRFYVPAFLFTAVVLFAGLIGYQRLASFLLVRSWVIVAIFVLAIGVHTVVLRVLRGWILTTDQPSQEGANLYESTVLLVTYIMVIAVGMLFLQIFGFLAPLNRVLGTALITAGDQNISLLVIIKALGVILIFVFSGRLVSNYLDYQVFPALNVDPGVATAVNTMITGLLMAMGVIFGLSTVGLDLRVLGFFAGALGLGIGFGLQGFANNLVSGLTLIFGRHIRRGDFVSVGENQGFVQQVGLRASRVRTRDAIEYTIPNSAFLDNQIVNWSHSSPFVRVHVPMGVSYGADPEEVRKVFLEIADAEEFVEHKPAPDVWFAGFGDSSLDFELLVWINVRRVAVGEIRSKLYFATFAALAEAGIEIPFPQRDLHIRSGLAEALTPPAPGDS